MPTDEEDARRNAAIPGMNQKVGAPPNGVGPKLGDALSADDPDVMRILESLRQQQSEWDHTTGRPRNPQERREAQILYLQIKEHADAQRAAREAEAQQRRDRELAEERNRLEAERNQIQAAEVQGKLHIEQQKVEIAKAEVVVSAIERIGRDPAMLERFGPMLDALGQRLLTGAGTGVSSEEATKLRLISTAAKPIDSNGSGQ